jgi:hypothetical protein
MRWPEFLPEDLISLRGDFHVSLLPNLESLQARYYHRNEFLQKLIFSRDVYDGETKSNNYCSETGIKAKEESGSGY